MRRSLALALAMLAASVHADVGDPYGSEFRVSEESASQVAVAMDTSGNAAVVWANSGPSGSAIAGRRLDASNVAQGAPFVVDTGSGVSPVVAMDDDGDFVVVWLELPFAANPVIYARRYDAAGVAQGAAFAVSNVPSSVHYEPEVAMDADGDFVVAWRVDGDVYARNYAADGTPSADAFLVGAGAQPQLGMDAAGNFVVAYDTSADMSLRWYAADGTALGGAVAITTGHGNAGFDMAMNANGDFVLAWQRACPTGGGSCVMARRYDELGVAQGSDTVVFSATTGSIADPAVAMDDTGKFVVTWDRTPDFDGDYFYFQEGVFARPFAADGTSLAAAARVNNYTPGAQKASSVAMGPGDDYLVAWQSGTDAMARRYRGATGARPSIDLAVAMTDAPDPVATEAPYTYTVTVTNNSATTEAANVEVNLTFGDFYYVESAAAAGWNCAEYVRCWMTTPLAPGASSSVQVQVQAEDFVTTMTASVSVTNVGATDPDATNDTATATTDVYDPGPGTLAFTAATATRNEDTGSVTVYVDRTGGSVGAASVHFATSNGSARATGDLPDYQATTGTLSWTNGDRAAKPIVVQFVNDFFTEGDETFTITLSSATGATLGTPATLTVTITDGDLAPPPLPAPSGGGGGGAPAGGTLLLLLAAVLVRRRP